METSEEINKRVHDYGKEGLRPIAELICRYGDTISKYIDTVAKGLEEGQKSIKDESPLVHSWFGETVDWIKELEKKALLKNPEELLNFIEHEGKKSSIALFATSVVTGSILGHFAKKDFLREQAQRLAEEPSEEKYIPDEHNPFIH